jgi:hypothetical protein
VSKGYQNPDVLHFSSSKNGAYIERRILYLSSWDHDTYLLDSFSELLWLQGVAVIQIEVFEGFQKDLLLILHST